MRIKEETYFRKTKYTSKQDGKKLLDASTSMEEGKNVQRKEGVSSFEKS